jgi:hypothetical protein
MSLDKEQALKAHTILTQAREFLSDEKRWCKEFIWNDDADTAGEAVQACSYGAIYKACARPEQSEPEIENDKELWAGAEGYLEQAIACRHPEFGQGMRPDHIASIVSFNDFPDTTHKDLMQTWDVAIAMAAKDAGIADGGTGS